jgi:hypothetical protein
MEETMHTYNYLEISIILLATCFSSSAAYAEVYRCVHDNGHVSYQQIRCHHNSKPLVLNHHRSGWTALRSGERALLDSYRDKDAAQMRKQPDTNPESGKDTKACWTRQTRLEAIKLRLRQGYTVKESNTLRRQRSNHEAYLRRFCSR